MPKVTRTELGFIVEPQVRKFCGPIFFTRSIKKVAGNVTANGSFGLVDSGSKKLLVTCYHVWDEFRNAQLGNPDLQMCICLDARNPVVFAPHEPLGQDRELDLVTFDMQPLLAACEGREFYRLDQTPPPHVEKEDVIFFIGFPGHLRCVQNDSQGFTNSDGTITKSPAQRE